MDKRARITENQEDAKRRKLEGQDDNLPIYATRFSQEEIEAQEKKPKRKVAVMVGYSGSGYKGMQLYVWDKLTSCISSLKAGRTPKEKTIEGDLFSAFVAAGAISKANADDPKKSSFVRCARTDKGVHAAGNLISLKLIVEDAEIIKRINEQLSPQIRIWGIVRTNGGFSAYHHCDSRKYEYHIPTHCFLPPHPKSFLALTLEELAKEVDDLDGYRSRLDDVADFWDNAEKKMLQPVIKSIAPSIRDRVLEVFYRSMSGTETKQPNAVAEDQIQVVQEEPDEPQLDVENVQPEDTSRIDELKKEEDVEVAPRAPRRLTPVEAAVRQLKATYVAARKGYRIQPAHLDRVRSAFSRFEGSHKFHNYTIDKNFKDASANRVIKSFTIAKGPYVVGNTEWISLRVHGQSFMMHQIRKMVSMVALMVRCGCPEERLRESYSVEHISIPKAPSLGLLLEYPVFDVYNDRLEKLGRDRIDFSKYSAEMEEFKQREIYERIYREEEKDACFHSFFTGLDKTRSAQLL